MTFETGQRQSSDEIRGHRLKGSAKRAVTHRWMDRKTLPNIYLAAMQSQNNHMLYHIYFQVVHMGTS